jgi:hypothetical protein
MAAGGDYRIFDNRRKVATAHGLRHLKLTSVFPLLQIRVPLTGFDAARE